ncbi:MAG: hypothetical protein LBC75_07720 [Fibromonadaceae bacterium]|jgi:hypothetical protein|nr:hypothetical protein [Fibromonadaceae bacterium]
MNFNGKTIFFILLFLALVTHAQEEQKRLAILNTEDNGEQELEYTDLLYLTDRLREIAVKMLPEDKYFVMTTQSIIDKMGSKENARKVCKEATCMAEIGRKISAEYIGQARLGRFGGNLTISMELYHSARGNLLGSFTGRAKDVFGLEAIINENAPQLFAKMSGVVYVPEPESAPTPTPVPKDAVPKFKMPKTSFWIALGLDVAGATVIYAGYVKHNEMWKAHDKYKKTFPVGSYIDDAWEDVESNHSSRNTLYAIGGILLASGVGVHIWF